MLSSRTLILLISIVCFGLSCRQASDMAQSGYDSTALDSTALDSASLDQFNAAHVFNPEDEYLGIGTPMYGDLDSMIARRKIRALVPYTHIYYSIEGNKRRGIAFEALNLFEKQINDQLKFFPPKVRIIFIPVNRKQIIPLLRDGYGDIAYAGMTITEEREKLVDFSIPTITGLKEIIVGNIAAPRLKSLADLSGKELYLHPGSSYEAAALKLSDSLERKGMAPIIIKPVDPYLETEDILQLVNAGVMPYSATVEDVARLWTHVMDSLVLYDSIPLASNVSYGMVMRKGSPQLKTAADKFVKKNAKGTAVGNTLYRRYIVSTKQLPNMHDKKTVAQTRKLRATFQKYADQYRLDWLLLIAQGYQESQLKQDAVSPVGAVGVMQVLPTTAAGRPLYIKNIHVVDNNVHAGVKYMRFLADQYFTGPDIDSLNTQLLALAAYNCGPGRVAQLRKKAKAKGLNPNIWFDNVEIIAAQEIGRETVQYVSNIYKFYTSYRALDYYREKKEEATKPL